MNYLKDMGAIAGIGGLALGVTLLLLKNFLEKLLAAQLGKTHAYRLMRLFLILVWLIAVIGIASYVFLEIVKRPVIAQLSPPPESPKPVVLNDQAKPELKIRDVQGDIRAKVRIPIPGQQDPVTGKSTAPGGIFYFINVSLVIEKRTREPVKHCIGELRINQDGINKTERSHEETTLEGGLFDRVKEFSFSADRKIDDKEIAEWLFRVKCDDVVSSWTPLSG